MLCRGLRLKAHFSFFYSPLSDSLSLLISTLSDSLSVRCSQFLNGLVSLETEPELLPSTEELTLKMHWTIPSSSSSSPSPSSSLSYDLPALHRWLTALEDTAQLSASTTGATTRGDGSPRRKSSVSSAAASAPGAAVAGAASGGDSQDTPLLQRQGHLFLCFDLAKRLVHSSCPALRSEAANILRSPSLPPLCAHIPLLRSSLPQGSERVATAALSSRSPRGAEEGKRQEPHTHQRGMSPMFSLPPFLSLPSCCLCRVS
jgi:hypothetical protein